jgi:F420-dependent oxidoreductase-like protein
MEEDMRIGMMAGAGAGPEPGVQGLIDNVKRLEERGFATAWMAQIFGHDVMTVLASAGRETSRIELGTAVVPSFPRHPFVMAQQALTVNAASNGRFALGIGLSHKLVIEDMWGMSYDKPAKHMREYLSVLGPLTRGETVSFKGEQFRVNAGLQVTDAKPPALLVAALGPVMLNLAGKLADGTITWMTGPKTLESHIIATISKAAGEAGKPAPRIVSGFPIALASDVEGARAKAAQTFQVYGILPSYRAMLDREGIKNPEDIAIVGDEKVLDTAIQRLRDIGVTDFLAAPFDAGEGTVQRTEDYLASRL